MVNNGRLLSVFFSCCKEQGCGNAYLHSSLPADELRYICSVCNSFFLILLSFFMVFDLLVAVLDGDKKIDL